MNNDRPQKPMISRPIIVLASLIFIACQAFWASRFRVEPGEQVLITRFGAPRGTPVTQAGMYYIAPFIDKVHRFPREIEHHLLRCAGAEEPQIVSITLADPRLFYETVRSIETIDIVLCHKLRRDSNPGSDPPSQPALDRALSEVGLKVQFH